ncbi:MAG: MFS transporter [Cytophagales bacterium]|nr:MFS transporter [Cytophagales bacterium]
MLRNYVRLVRKHPKPVGFGIMHYFFSSYGQSFFLSLFVPSILESFRINNNEFSVIYSAATLTSALLLSYLGPSTDRCDIRKVSLANGAMLGFFCLSMYFTANLPLLLFTLIGLRLSGFGMMPLTGAAAVGKFFHKNRGKALALSSIGMSIAEMGAPVLIVLLLHSWGWQIPWLFFLISLTVIFGPLSAWLGRSLRASKSARRSDKYPIEPLKRRKLLKNPGFLLLASVVVFSPFMTTGFFIHQNLILGNKLWTPEWLASCFVGFGACRILATLLSGPFIDKFTAKRVAFLIPLPITAGLLLLTFTDHALTLLFYLSMNGLSLSFGSLTGTALWAELYGSRSLGTVKSLVSTLMAVGTAISPLIFGEIFQDKATMEYGFLTMALLGILLSGVIYYYLNFRYRKMN